MLKQNKSWVGFITFSFTVRAFFIFLLVIFLPLQAGAQIATFKTLNKVTGKTALVEFSATEPMLMGSLVVTLRSCSSTPPEEPPETTAFVEIDTWSQTKERLFSGWMFASTPGLNGLEHPVYDLWPISCKTASGDIFTGKE